MTESPKPFFADPEAYRRFMGRWSAKLARPFLDFAGLGESDNVLDVGSGTGNLALAIMERAPNARVTGIDPSPPYVEYAKAQVPSAHFETADAQALPFAAATFDRALCQLVLNFIPDPRRALEEMRRVTRPGATISAATWDLSGGMRMLDEFWEAVGDSAAGSPFAERTTTLTKEELVVLWSEARLARVDATDIVISTDFASFDDYWSPFLLGVGPSGAYATSLATQEQESLRERLRRRVLGGRPDGPFSLQARSFAVRGTVE